MSKQEKSRVVYGHVICIRQHQLLITNTIMQHFHTKDTNKKKRAVIHDPAFLTNHPAPLTNRAAE